MSSKAKNKETITMLLNLEQCKVNIKVRSTKSINYRKSVRSIRAKFIGSRKIENKKIKGIEINL